jgi:hypothetical protein
MFGPGIGGEHLDGAPILNEFLEAARQRKVKRGFFRRAIPALRSARTADTGSVKRGKAR